MKVDVNSMFFNSKIKGKTATPAWGSSIGQNKANECRIKIDKPDVVDMVIGMTYKSVTNLDKLDISKGSSDREVLICSVFNNVYINNIKIDNAQYVLLLVREHSASHDGRLIISYAPYIEYNNKKNQECIDSMTQLLGCSPEGCWFVYDISIKNQSDLYFSAVVVNPTLPMIYDENTSSTDRSEKWKSLIPVSDGFIAKPLQQIFYGAPGTGKSHEIKEKTEGQKVVRTTFHPDSDYSSFVGAYKPTMEEVDAQVVPVVVNSGISLEPKGTYKEKRITYKFVIQAFLKAYLGAWKMYSDNPHSPDPQFLVIEEINRGNCAQIFGDLFQLLDRNEKGFSEYPIEADSDLADAINIAFTNEKSDYKLEKVIDVEGVIKDYISNYGFTLSKDIQEGRVLLLPPNLFIWATMNTSDQSLFPIDSAFKRRWDWQYIKITEGKQDDSSTPLGWKILVEDEEQDRVRLYDWWRFLQLINTKIFGATDSADKQMGYFFTKATESFSGNKLGVIKKEGAFVEETSQSPKNCDFITAETFVNKVLFYLWTDVLKDNEYDEITSLMKVGDKPLSFPDFFGETGKEISPEALRVFLDNVMKDEDVWCEVAEWTIVTPQTTGNGNTNTNGSASSNFKSKSVIFKITENIQDPDLLYERARKSWRMADSRAMKIQYFYVYSTPVREITACYRVKSREKVLKENGKYRYEFKGILEENDPMINKPVEAISHSRGQVVFYPENWGGVQTDDNNDKESLNENPV